MFIVVKINNEIQIREPNRDNLVRDKWGNYWSQNNEVIYSCHSVLDECTSLQEALDKALFYKAVDR